MLRNRKSVQNPIIHVKPLQRFQDESHYFYDSITIYWCVLFLLGLVPIRKDKNGELISIVLILEFVRFYKF